MQPDIWLTFSHCVSQAELQVSIEGNMHDVAATPLPLLALDWPLLLPLAEPLVLPLELLLPSGLPLTQRSL